MKKQIFALVSLALLAVNPQLSNAFAQGTAFTYQGRVTDNGTNFNGTGQFKFALVTGTNISSTATATASAPISGFITTITVTDGGSGYTTAPTVTITGGAGSGATATAQISAGGEVTNITVNDPGSGYTSTPTVTVAAPPPNISYTTYWSNDGTSVNGSEPVSAVSVSVANGLFSEVLGDTTQPNMTAIPSTLFMQADLQLRIWFNDGVNGSVALSPVLNLTPAPYAIVADIATSVDGGLTVQTNSQGAPNVIAGASVNYVSNTVVGATISGGGEGSDSNSVTANFGTVSGGSENSASGAWATVPGGIENTASGSYAMAFGDWNIASGEFSLAAGSLCEAAGYASIALGVNNYASGIQSCALGGQDNIVTSTYSFAAGADNTSGGFASVALGNFNTASGSYSFTAGVNNTASGYASIALGNLANANLDNTFLWNGFPNGVSSFASSRFQICCTNGLSVDYFTQRPDGGGTHWCDLGVFTNQTISTWTGAFLSDGGVWQNASDRNRKTDLAPIDAESVLEKLAGLPVTCWRYTNEVAGVKHIGPMAQDFKAAFDLGTDDKTIGTVDEGGVALAAIQGLNQKLEADNAELRQENSLLARRLDELEAEVKALSSQR